VVANKLGIRTGLKSRGARKRNNSLAKVEKEVAREEKHERKERVPDVITPARDAAVAYGFKKVQKGPKFTGNMFAEGGSVGLEHSELLSELPGSVSYSATAVAIQPGLASVFTYGSKVASMFETYEFDYLRIEYTPYCPSSTNGLVMLAMDYDAADTTPATKKDLSLLSGFTQGSCWNRVTVNFDRKMMNRIRHFIRTTGLPSNNDIKFYDSAILYVATVGMATTANVGDITISYRLKLYTPQINSSLFVNAQTAMCVGRVSVASVASSAAVYTNMTWNSGTTNLPFGGANLSTVQWATGLNNTLTFTMPGYYLYCMTGTGMTTAIASGASISFAGPNAAGSSWTQIRSGTDAGGTTWTSFGILVIAGAGTSITNNFTSICSSWTGGTFEGYLAWYQTPNLFTPRVADSPVFKKTQSIHEGKDDEPKQSSSTSAAQTDFDKVYSAAKEAVAAMSNKQRIDHACATQDDLLDSNNPKDLITLLVRRAIGQ